jgi:hypothetical protein
MASKVSVGKTSPVPLGQQPAANSLPVVFAEDQAPIPVEEQNKIQSEVALSLLGIPRAEVALGIFADVNTYDVNPAEWAQAPLENVTDPTSPDTVTDGVVHVAEEAGARLIASDGNTTILTSKRFFRYQPGRVSASTMGVKMNVTGEPNATMKGAPSIKKWGIFDKFDGYYFEIANAGKANDFRCVRRTQAIIPSEPPGYSGNLAWFNSVQDDNRFSTSTNFGVVGVDPVIIRDGLVYTAAAIYDPSLCYSPESVNAIDSSTDPTGQLKNYNFDSGYALRLATYNGSTWTEVMNNRQHQFPFDQSTTINKADTAEDFLNYIRLDSHCNFYAAIANLNRKGTATPTAPTSKEVLASTGLFGANLDLSHNTILNTYGWDEAPSDQNSNSKVWHLMVNTQGRISGKTIVTADLTSSPVVPNRDVLNGNVTLKEWFNLCVPKPYRMVYEWRPVRAMFSGDKLDGVQDSVVRWSDVNTSAEDVIVSSGGGIVNLPGEIIKTAEGNNLTSSSLYNVDFTKVTMWKTEYSWYGAVGATFLCYVPVGNNEARWVRVHHIRASNQHSVASLGNAFLPITYLCHGGISSGLDPNNGGNDVGNTLVKYGASYYIDGGDKGTVKLLSKSSDYQREVPKGFYTFNSGTFTLGDSNRSLTYTTTNHPALPKSAAIGLINSYIESDVTNKVIWLEDSGSDVKVWFSTALPTSGNIKLIIPRAQRSLMSVRAKDFISNRDGKAVRNRLQIYPIKYGAGVSNGASGDLVTLRMYKNPLMIVSNSSGTAGTDIAPVGTARNPVTTSEKYVNTKRSTLPVEVGWDTAAPSTLLADGKYRYGYFLGTTSQSAAQSAGSTVTPATSGFFPVLGKLERVGSSYFFSKYSSYAEEVYIAGKFIPERHLILDKEGTTTFFTEENIAVNAAGLSGSTGSADQTKWDRLNVNSLATFEDITRLSGVRVAQDMALTPISETGNEILSFYVSNGGYQFDLQDYFAYNKEYLSFPLTDEVDIINIYAHFDLNSSVSPANFKISNSLSWEEQ